MAKEKNFNPVAAHHKAEKAKNLKKSKAQVAAQRTEKLARRNPERIQRQIDDLKAAQEAGELRPHDRQRLEQLEKDLKGIRKARETLGDKAPQFSERRNGEGEGQGHGRNRGRGGDSVLGKRRRSGYGEEGDSSETDEDVRDIPMPRDTPPPLPRREKRSNNPNLTPLGVSPDGVRLPHALPSKPIVESKTVYEAAPVHRDLRKEATRFVPAAVQVKFKAARGEGRLLEPEELEKLEQAGYKDAKKAAKEAEKEATFSMMNFATSSRRKGEDIDLESEEAKFERELMDVEKDLDIARQNTADAMRRDITGLVDEAEKEAEFSIMARGIDSVEGEKGERLVEKTLDNVGKPFMVQMEDASDEDP
ncbi:hypothetical protein M501DRAFT_1003199 [Patellaria atrata CBS 101060]|uniref:Wbp11/ELF5/Saf1 N-terminal domain-containing protein n=1 Tax=Patellaria atrata CBS 101060 TaxID=1346257 RepID=A0A9P4SBS2_9PEZI|nr:hypothetical protein M501DRAFT_1003199 [Patellaria atrata CBS 101060]